MSERIRRFSASPYEPQVGYCRAIQVGDRVLVGGCAPIGPDGNNVEGDAYVQAVHGIPVMSKEQLTVFMSLSVTS